MSSVPEEIARAGFRADPASKAGAATLTKTPAQQAAPGELKAPLNPAIRQDLRRRPPRLGKSGLGRLGPPEGPAAGAAIRVSAAAGIPGRTMVVAGGLTDYPAFAHGG